MPERSRHRHLVALVACTALFLVMCALAPSVPLDVRLAYILGFLLVSAEIVLVARVAPVERPLHLVGVLLLSAVLLASQRGAAVTMAGSLAVTLALLLAATGVGVALGWRIER